MEIMFLPHALLPRLVTRRSGWHTGAGVAEHRLKGRWKGNNRDIGRQQIHLWLYLSLEDGQHIEWR